MRSLLHLLPPLFASLAACGPGKIVLDPDTADTATTTQDILSTDLALDLEALRGEATIRVQPATDARSVTLDVSGLSLSRVTVDGAEVEALLSGGQAKIPVSATGEPVQLVLDWTFEARSEATFDGWMPDLGVSFIWPYSCANLFPCDPATADGLTFTLDVTGTDPTLTAVFPSAIISDAPPYMPAVAVGDYAELELGTTSAGTHLRAWYLDEPGGLEDAEFGTAHLVSAFEFFETTYGPYAFGPDVGTVEVDWGRDSTGGMEHHPYFHVARDDFWNEETQVHEAAHGWFGDAVRLACWEDFVLSEGTVTYMAARGLEQAGGPDLWPAYVDDFLTPICEGRQVNAIVMPDTCNEIDFENDNLWSLATYMKGACFYEDVADEIGQELLDEAIAEFYQANMNQPATMRAMIETIHTKAGDAHTAAIDQLVQDWLLTLACPDDYAARCRAHEG